MGRRPAATSSNGSRPTSRTSSIAAFAGHAGRRVCQRTNAFYQPPGGRDATEFLQGMYKALLDGRFLFDFVHEDDLVPETLAKYKALILPNVALLSSAQCSNCATMHVAAGLLLATFETGFYDESSKSRSDWRSIRFVWSKGRGKARRTQWKRCLRPHRAYPPDSSGF